MNQATLRKLCLRVGLTFTVLAFASLANAQRALHTREFFYIGGKYVGQGDEQTMAGQMYVEVLRPQKVTQKYPILLLHSNASGTLWLGTPDGRPGWADYFLNQGYLVYLPDQPARGRSPWHANINSPLRQSIPLSRTEAQDTVPELFDNYPNGKKHTQWPGSGEGKGKKGDAVFDAFYSMTLDTLSNGKEAATMVQDAVGALLERVGPVIVLTHSQTGPFGWSLADGHPKMVKAVVAVEPTGPPFRNALANGGKEDEARPWGLTVLPLHYDPPVSSPNELGETREATADGPDLANCWGQKDPPRQLPNLKGIPILIASGEASYHWVYDHCTSKYLTRAGVANTHLRFEDAGIRGNAHFIMLEKNNLEAAAVLHKWIQRNVK